MRKRDNQIIFVGFILALLTTSLLGCKNSGGAKEEKSRTELVEQKKKIIAKESFHKFRESMDGKISPQWLLSDSLSKYATIEEIEKLATTDKDPIKRLVAFRALLTKDPHQAVNLAISNIEDTTIVATTDGDCGEEDRVSNVRICMLQYHRERNHITYNDSVRLDSAALFSQYFPLYGYSYRFYHHMPAKPEYETRLRQLYKQDPWALVALTKYHREKEKQEIILLLSKAEDKDSWDYRDTLRVALHAVAAWPDGTFIPLVKRECEKILGEDDNNGCMDAAFRALFAYHSQWSYDMVEKSLAKAKQNEKNYFDVCWTFHEVYENHPQPLFKPLIKKYSLDDNKNKAIFQ